MTDPSRQPRFHYARNGDINIAYTTMGSGPVDMVFVQGSITNLAVLLARRSLPRLSASVWPPSRASSFSTSAAWACLTGSRPAAPWRSAWTTSGW